MRPHVTSKVYQALRYYQDGYARVAERGQLCRVQVVASCYRRLCGCGLNVAKRPPVVELGDPALAPELAHVASSVARVGLFQKVAREALGQERVDEGGWRRGKRHRQNESVEA